MGSLLSIHRVLVERSQSAFRCGLACLALSLLPAASAQDVAPGAVEPQPASIQFAFRMVKEWTPDRAYRVEREIGPDGKGGHINHGIWNLYDAQDRLLCRGNFVHGVKQGTWSRFIYEEDAQSPLAYPLCSEVHFENDQLHGPWTISDGQQRLLAEADLIQGQLEGPCLWHYPQGGTRRTAHFTSGVLQGELREYAPNGDLLFEGDFHEGVQELPYVKDYQNGQRQMEGRLQRTCRLPQLVQNWESAQLEIQWDQTSDADRRHGIWTAWFPDGSKYYECHYSQGELHGTYTQYFPNGQVEFRGEFAQDQPHGTWTWYHRNGLRSREGKYLAGQQQGIWYEWNPAGQVAQRIDMDNRPGEERAVAESVENAEQTVPANTARRDEDGSTR